MVYIIARKKEKKLFFKKKFFSKQTLIFFDSYSEIKIFCLSNAFEEHKKVKF